MARLSRRRLLQLGVGGSLALALGGGALAWFRVGYALRPGEVALGLDTKTFCVMRAVVEALLPGERGFPSGVAVATVQRIDEEVWAADDGLQSDVQAVLQVVEHAPPLFGKFGRFSSLSPKARLDVLDGMLRSSLDVFVQSAGAVRQLALVYYFSDPRTWKPLGYEGPWVGEAKPPVSATRYAQLLAQNKVGS